MNLHKQNILNHKNGINRLRLLLPDGVAIPSRWLTDRHYSRQSLNQYKRRGYLLSPARGVYVLPGLDLSWHGVVLGLQRLSGLTNHVGGVTALGLQGKAHYLPLGGEKQVHMWGKARLPAWVNQCGLPQEFLLHPRTLFSEQEPGGLITVPTKMRDWEMSVSGPERAVLEVCSTLDDSEESFIATAELMEGLTNLRPRLVNELLVNCQSVKAKRVFLYLAFQSRYEWAARIQQDRIDLGSGKRQVVKGGRLEKEFQITVPKGFGRAFSSGFGRGFA